MTFPLRGLHLSLATLLLLVQVLGAPVLRAMPCAAGGPEVCCCAGWAQPAPSQLGCCGGGEETPRPEAPEPDGPCGCHQAPAPTPVPAPDPMPRAVETALIEPAPVPIPAAPPVEAAGFRPAPEPRSRTGPPLHLRYCVFLD